LDGSEHNVKKNTAALVVASKEIELEVNSNYATWPYIEIRMQDEVTM
jgi:hypothetical protein